MACPPLSCAVQVLLMEGVHEVAAAAFAAEGFNVVQHVKLTAAQLVIELADTHIIGIRSKTVLTADVLDKVTHAHTPSPCALLCTTTHYTQSSLSTRIFVLHCALLALAGVVIAFKASH
jgi:hypothetical protein